MCLRAEQEIVSASDVGLSLSCKYVVIVVRRHRHDESRKAVVGGGEAETYTNMAEPGAASSLTASPTSRTQNVQQQLLQS